MTSQSTATLRSRYIERAASDLEENRHQQEELTKALARLKHEEALLVDILSLAERHEGLRVAAESSAQKRSGTHVPAGRPAQPPSQQTTRRSAHLRERRLKRVLAESGAKGKSRQPLLGEILTALLGAHSEPRLAKELHAELTAKHPDRSPTPQVVRNTLESLVAKGQVQRHKQQRSVMYTLADDARGGVPAEEGDAVVAGG
ncbi:hypothetical protein ACIHBQ_20960 [Streptomyces sp. NPDC052492]|uniref:hypothetical protein n=1 Tax=Streptomyces sp. NPDC052492 TaxID=3365691 RepID=UPI0037D39CDE